MRIRVSLPTLLLTVALIELAPARAQTDPNRVYRCPDNTYTNDLSEVRAKNCKLVDNANVSIMSTPAPLERAAPKTAPRTESSAQRSAQIPPDTQRQRDLQARAILEQELAQQKAKLAQLLKEYNNGQPERLGDEKNYQKYLDRVSAMKDSIIATEANIAALERELQKFPP